MGSIIKAFGCRLTVSFAAAILVCGFLPGIAFAATQTTDIEALGVQAVAHNMTLSSAAKPLAKAQATPVWPAGDSSLITSPYGYRVHPIYGDIRFHYGLDIGVDQGTPVVSPLAGTVYTVSWSDAVGNTVEIDHGGGIITRYCHLSAVLYAVGQPLSQGQVFALSGSTGYLSTGPHLHFEVYDLINSNNDWMAPYYTYQRCYTIDPQVWLTYTPPPPTPAIPPDYGRSLIIKDTLSEPMTRILSATSADPAFAPNEAWRSGMGAFDGNRAKMTTGDFNGDGFTDAAMLYDYGSALSAMWIFIWETDHYVPHLSWASGMGSWDTNRSKIVSGDFAGDGKTDIGILYDYGKSTSGMWIFTTAVTGNDISSTPARAWVSGNGCFDWSRAVPVGGDFMGDDKADVSILYDYGASTSGLWTLVNSSGTMAPVSSWMSGKGAWDPARSKIVAGQFAGDAKSDIALLYDYGASTSGVWTFIANGNVLAPNLAWASEAGHWDAARCKIASGNFGGDADSDLAILYDYGNSSAGIWTLITSGTNMVEKQVWGSSAGAFDSSRMKLDGS